MKNVFRDIEEKVEIIEKKFGSLENFVISTTIPLEKHKLKMRENSFKEMVSVYKDLEKLETCDLLDFQNLSSEDYGDFG